MNGGDGFGFGNIRETKRSRHSYRVLLLDSDTKCLVNLSEALRKCGYLVVATTRADELPIIISNKDEKIDLLLAEFRLIETNKYQLLDKFRSISEIPVVVMGGKAGSDVIADCLNRGAEFYLTKPLTETNLDYLEQFIFKGERDELNQNNKNVKDHLGRGKKRKERVDRDTRDRTEKDFGDRKKPEPVRVGHLQTGTLGAIPNEEEANNERKEPIEIQKNGEEESVNSEFKMLERPEPVRMEAEPEMWSTHTVTDFDAFVKYVFEERDFEPMESVGESAGYQIPLSPMESSNMKGIAAQTHKAMEDGLSLADLEFDLQEGQDSTDVLDNKANDERLNDIFTDLAKELKP